MSPAPTINPRLRGGKRAVEININGILAAPGRADGWTDRAVTLAHVKYGMRAEKFEHFSGVLTRHIFQERRAVGLATLADRYLAAGFAVYLRGHSNGCDVICRALKYLRHGAIEAIGLIAAAAEPDFARNGLNAALLEGRVSRVVLGCSPDDRALWLARATHPFLNLVGNGYGCLGFCGPLNVDDHIEHRVRTHWRPGYDHGTWFDEPHLLETLLLLHGGWLP